MLHVRREGECRAGVCEEVMCDDSLIFTGDGQFAPLPLRPRSRTFANGGRPHPLST